MADLFWLSDAQWAVIEPFMPKDQPGPERKDDRMIISRILRVLKDLPGPLPLEPGRGSR